MSRTQRRQLETLVVNYRQAGFTDKQIRNAVLALAADIGPPDIPADEVRRFLSKHNL